LELQDIDTSYTLGVLEQQRQETLARLVAENRGYIWKEGETYRTKNQELPLPLVIRNIALVSALNSAGAEDFRHTLEYNDHGYRFRIDEYHTAVQGEHNAEAFLDCLISVYRAQTPYDVVVITRGGGAQSDFLIFDNYRIGQAVAKYPIPVITGIGHQKNETVADLMAHTALKTPTKAAEFIIAHNRAFEDRITALQQTIIIRSQQILSGQMQALAARKSALVNHTRDILSREKDGMASLNQSVTSHTRNILYGAKSALLRSTSVLVSRPGAIISRKQHDLSTITGNIRTFKAQYLKNQQGYLNHFRSMIRMMSPENILRKGFALVKVDSRITSDPAKLTPGRDMDIILSDTQVSATVKQKTPYDGNDFNI
jgi:exodeoxyribonuclease VII large subunit